MSSELNAPGFLHTHATKEHFFYGREELSAEHIWNELRHPFQAH